MSELIIPPLDL